MKVFVIDRYRVATVGIIAAVLGVGAISASFKTQPVLSQSTQAPIYCVDRPGNAVSITFDCADTNGDIAQILDVLQKHNAKATFFVLGTWAEKFPESVKSIYDNGHEIGNHSYNHICYTTLSNEEILADIARCDDAVFNAIGRKSTVFRAPSGDYNDNVVNICRQNGITYVQWSIDSLDWTGLNCEQMLKRIVPKAKGGDILLFHNGTAHTAASLDRILTELEKKGLSFSKVGDLIYKDNYSIDHTGKQIRLPK